jgi:hypothetical protein
MTASVTRLPTGLPIAILEDQPRGRERLVTMLTQRGFFPIPISPRAPSLDELAGHLQEIGAKGVVCDHRLTEHNYATFLGAEAVAAAYHAGVGGVLVTNYEREDSETSIRRSRRWVPELLHSATLDPADLAFAVSRAVCEASGEYLAPARTSYRTLIRVVDVVTRNQVRMARVSISQWQAKTIVAFPVDMVPEFLRDGVVPGALLVAQVNVDAERSEDLFFDDFQAPDPNAIRDAQTIFGSG